MPTDLTLRAPLFIATFLLAAPAWAQGQRLNAQQVITLWQQAHGHAVQGNCREAEGGLRAVMSALAARPTPEEEGRHEYAALLLGNCAYARGAYSEAAGLYETALRGRTIPHNPIVKADAAARLGRMCRDGTGVVKDPDRAVGLLLLGNNCLEAAQILIARDPMSTVGRHCLSTSGYVGRVQLAKLMISRNENHYDALRMLEAPWHLTPPSSTQESAAYADAALMLGQYYANSHSDVASRLLATRYLHDAGPAGASHLARLEQSDPFVVTSASVDGAKAVPRAKNSSPPPWLDASLLATRLWQATMRGWMIPVVGGQPNEWLVVGHDAYLIPGQLGRSNPTIADQFNAGERVALVRLFEQKDARPAVQVVARSRELGADKKCQAADRDMDMPSTMDASGPAKWVSLKPGERVLSIGLQGAIGYAGGGATVGSELLLHVAGTNLLPIACYVTSHSSLLAGSWREDGSREHFKSSSSWVVRMTDPKIAGWPSLQILPRQGNAGQMTLRWDSGNDRYR